MISGIPLEWLLFGIAFVLVWPLTFGVLTLIEVLDREPKP